MQKILMKICFLLAGCFLNPSLQSLPYSLPCGSHFVAGVDLGSGILELEDGSQWQISRQNIRQLHGWSRECLEVPVEITPNYCSNSYTYCITHEDTGSCAKANLIKAPRRDNPYAVTILAIDKNRYNFGTIHLSNGTSWHVNFRELEGIRHWYLDDLIIIGKNTEWFSWNSHILINIHTNTFVRAQRL